MSSSLAEVFPLPTTDVSKQHRPGETAIHAISHTVRQNLTEFGYFATHFP